MPSVWYTIFNNIERHTVFYTLHLLKLIYFNIRLNAYSDTVRPTELRGPISNDDEVVVSSTKPKFKTGIQASMNCSSNNWETYPLSYSYKTFGCKSFAQNILNSRDDGRHMFRVVKVKDVIIFCMQKVLDVKCSGCKKSWMSNFLSAKSPGCQISWSKKSWVWNILYAKGPGCEYSVCRRSWMWNMLDAKGPRWEIFCIQKVLDVKYCEIGLG